MRLEQIELFPGSSTCLGPLPDYVLKSSIDANLIPIYPMCANGDELQEVVKDIYGDDFVFTNGHGRPFPPKYKNLAVDPRSTAGE